MRKLFRRWKEYEAIKQSGLFDRVYYLLHNPDVRQAGVDPLSHFLGQGWQEGRNPSAVFDTRFYLTTYPDVQQAGTNPLLHYLRFGQSERRARNPIEHASQIAQLAQSQPKHPKRALIEVLELLDPEPQLPVFSVSSPIDIVIPIYNGRELLEALLSGIVQNTSIPYRLLLGNDKSPDPLMSGYLKDFQRQHPQLDVTVIEHEENVGFLQTVNQLAALTHNHFVILNTDTEVPPHWLERLMAPILTQENVASTTPFTNAGILCSFPTFLEDNPLFQDLDLVTLDAFFQLVNMAKNQVEVPTGVGFCMGINKQVWEQIGPFDEAFGKGYGEENDWCMRAIKVGYHNQIVPNLFVYHKHGGSFPSAEKQQLGEKNLQLLQTRHPEYSALVADFIQRDPLKDLRSLLQIKILSTLQSPQLILDHALSGGASMYSKELIAQEKLSAVITPGQNPFVNYAIRFGGQKLEDMTFELRSVREIEQIIQQFHIDEVILNELVGYPKPRILELVDFLIGLAKNNPDLKITYMVHDYFGVCPIYTLLDYNIKYCGVPSDLSYCDKCLQLNPLMNVVAPLVKQDYPALTMNVWREHFGELLDVSSKIVCFSQSSKAILQRAYPLLPDEKIEVTPHTVDWVQPVEIRKNSKQLNIAVVGHMEVQKGSQIISLLATYVDYHNLNIVIHVFGEIFEPNESFGFLKKVVKHGRFTRTDLTRLMEENEIDLVLIPSICPETFSFTTEEAMHMHLPLAVFDLGAPVERVQHYDKGIVLQQQEPQYILEKIYAYFNKKLLLNSTIRKDLTFVCASNNELAYTRNVLSSAFMTEHPILKYDNRETNLPIPSRYNESIDKLLASNYHGWIFFVHNDFSLLEAVDSLIDSLDHHCLYGPVGAILVNGEKKLVGQILQGHNGGLIYHGTPIDKPILVDTVDCQCLLAHTDLLRAHPLRFDEDERLDFHQYVEEFCIQANVKYGVQTYAVPIQCKHTNWRTLNRSFDLAIDYIRSKYPYKQWAGTFTHLS